MLRACSSRFDSVASSGSVGVSNRRNTVLPHLSHVNDDGTAVSKDFSLPQVKHTSDVTPCVFLLLVLFCRAIHRSRSGSGRRPCKTHALLHLAHRVACNPT